MADTKKVSATAERLIRVEAEQQHLLTAFHEHTQQDSTAFEKLSIALVEMKVSQAKVNTTIWLAGCFVTMLVPFLVVVLNKVF